MLLCLEYVQETAHENVGKGSGVLSAKIHT